MQYLSFSSLFSEITGISYFWVYGDHTTVQFVNQDCINSEVGFQKLIKKQKSIFKFRKFLNVNIAYKLHIFNSFY